MGLDNSNLAQLTETVLLVAVISIILVLFSVCFLHIYFKVFRNTSGLHFQVYPNSTTAAAADPTASSRHHRVLDSLPFGSGLDPSVMRTIPVVSFREEKFKEKLECAVCLCEVFEGKKVRFLPNCNHVFHVDCIDMWFQSHSTCPLCRNPLTNPSVLSFSSRSESTLDSVDIQIAGSGSTSTCNATVIDIPQLIVGEDTGSS